MYSASGGKGTDLRRKRQLKRDIDARIQRQLKRATDVSKERQLKTHRRQVTETVGKKEARI